jgi:hypothetical protein
MQHGCSNVGPAKEKIDIGHIGEFRFKTNSILGRCRNTILRDVTFKSTIQS